MCKVYGYARISRKTQDINRQIRNILAFDTRAYIEQEAYTGTKTAGREKWNNLFKKVKAGDTIVFDSVSRMARNAEEGTAMYFELYDRSVNLVFLKERHIDTQAYDEAVKAAGISIDTDDSAEGQLVSDIVTALNKFIRAKIKADIYKAFEQAEKEVTDLHERTREGIETARLNGKQIGQREGAKLTTKKSIEMKSKIQKMARDFGGNMTDGEVIETLKLARNTYYKYKKELTEDLNK